MCQAAKIYICVYTNLTCMVPNTNLHVVYARVFKYAGNAGIVFQYCNLRLDILRNFSHHLLIRQVIYMLFKTIYYKKVIFIVLNEANSR